MLVSGSLNIIAEHCRNNYLQINCKPKFLQVVSFIENEIAKENLLPPNSFDNYKNAFYKAIATTLNKNALIQSEINSINTWLGEAFLKIPDSKKIYDTIYSCILINKDRREVLERFYNNYFIKDNAETFVRIIYVYDLIKYRCFLEGNPLENMPETTLIQQSENKTEFINISKYEGQMNLTIQELKKLKPKFEKLKIYSDKLKFWDKFFIGENSIGIAYSYFFNEIDTEEERQKPENFITIFPKSKEETEQFNVWLLNHIQNQPHYNFEKQKEKYFEIIKDNPLPLEYTLQEIETIEKQRDKEKKLMQEKKDIFLWSYYLGYNSVIQKKKPHLQMEAEKFFKIVLPYAKGVEDAYFLGFLKTHLKQLEQGVQPPQQIKNNTEYIPLLQSAGQKEQFKKDFETKDFSTSWDTQRGIFYTINGNYYDVFTFWTYLKNYHLEKTEEMNYEEKIKYLKRIIPQIKKVGNQHFERFIKLAPIPRNECEVVFESVNYAVSDLQVTIDDNERYLNEQKVNAKSPHQTETGTEQPNLLKLSDIFDSISKYNQIMNLLVEKQYCFDTYKWKDKKTGYQSTIMGILRRLDGEGYYKNDFTLNYKNAKVISKNTFNVEVKSNKTFYNAHPEHKDFDFIKPASTVS